MPEPELPEEIDADELDAEVRRELRSMPKGLADLVAQHLVAAGRLVDEDPEQALLHARFARSRAARVGVVREASGLAAYHAGEWAEALSELRAARRMTGGAGHLAVMADCERALGRPERAVELPRSPEAKLLTADESVELRIVAAGARRDMGQLDAAVVALQTKELDPKRRDSWSARLFYAYADNLAAAGRTDEAIQWFLHAADADDDGLTDAGERASELGDGLRFGESPDVDATEPLAHAEPAPDQDRAADSAAEQSEHVDSGHVADTSESRDSDESSAEPGDADQSADQAAVASTEDASTEDASTADVSTDDAPDTVSTGPGTVTAAEDKPGATTQNNADDDEIGNEVR